MKKMALVTTLSFFIFLCGASCQTELAPADKFTYLRIANQSGFDFTNVVVASRQYGDIKRGERSEYRKLDGGIYRYAAVRLRAGKKDLSLQPIDYVGESLFGPGRFTYVLNVQTNSQLNVITRKDETPPGNTLVKGKDRNLSRKNSAKVRVRNSSGILLRVKFPLEPVSVKSGETSDYYDQGGPWLPGEIEVYFDQPVPRVGGDWEQHHMRWFARQDEAREAAGEWHTYTVTIATNLSLSLSFEHDK